MNVFRGFNIKNFCVASPTNRRAVQK